MLPKGPYKPQEEEPKILSFWLDNKFYKPEYDPKDDRVVSFEELMQNTDPTFCIVNPPPNAYGRPHLGNVSGYAYQDLLLRYHRAKGYKVYGQPGKDHAGIQGEIVVLREHFKKQGKNKHNMTREQFYKETYDYFLKIKEQAKRDEQRIGLSSDFDRDTFTLDSDIVKTVLQTFIDLYNDGMVYKGVRIVNWCPSCKTALADIDTEPKERTTDFVYIKYPRLNENQRVWRLSFYKQEILEAILNGVKTIETRALNPEEPERFFGDIKTGDIVVAVDKTNHQNAIPFRVKRVAIYKNLKELYENEDVSKINSSGRKPSFTEFEQGYANLAEGYLEKINKNGIVAIEVKHLELSEFKPKYRLLIGTSNKFKQKLFKTELGDLGLVIKLPKKQLKIKEGEKSLLKNAEQKAIEYSKEYPDILVVANDGGTIIPYLGENWNKVLTKRQVGGENATEEERAQALLRLMESAPEDKRTIYWEGAFAVALNGKILFSKIYKETPGIVAKKIHPAVKKSQGDWLGYIWYYPELKKYSFELTRQEKKDTNWAIVQFKRDFHSFLLTHGFISYITVATTRPETMLGDTAVVVNPKDQRYRNLIGRKVLLPLVWREIPIISDPIVDKELGTGALKLTPSHAYDDYQIMLRWNKENPQNKIDYINVIDKNAQMVGPVGKFFGLSTDTARKQVIESLKDYNLVEKIEEKEQLVQVCERCKTVIEPQMSSQWFIEVENLKKPAIEVVKKGEIKIHPKNMTKVYLQWMNNLRDWPISRSLWWGYRFPVWYKHKPEEVIDPSGKVVTKIGEIQVQSFQEAVEKGLATISIEPPQKDWVQSDYVFDTWFSSGQWAYAPLMKWGLFEKFYPTSVMETGYDILQFWVSRMIMLGIYKTGKIPFKDVYLHGLIKSFDGQKMSKSKGNIVDPDEIIAEYGADVLRLFYIVGNKAGANYQITKDKLEGNKRFLNKLWNASKFVLFNIQDLPQDALQLTLQELKLSKSDKKMLSEAKKITQKVQKQIEAFKFGFVAVDLRNHFWEVFCDWYLEDVKTRLYTKDREGNSIDYDKQDRLAAQWTLITVLKQYLKILHPYIPFVTERLWQEVPKKAGEHRAIMFNQW